MKQTPDDLIRDILSHTPDGVFLEILLFLRLSEILKMRHVSRFIMQRVDQNQVWKRLIERDFLPIFQEIDLPPSDKISYKLTYKELLENKFIKQMHEVDIIRWHLKSPNAISTYPNLQELSGRNALTYPGQKLDLPRIRHSAPSVTACVSKGSDGGEVPN